MGARQRAQNVVLEQQSGAGSLVWRSANSVYNIAWLIKSQRRVRNMNRSIVVFLH